MVESDAERKEQIESTVMINNYNYALSEEFDYLDKEEELDSADLNKVDFLFSKSKNV